MIAQNSEFALAFFFRRCTPLLKSHRFKPSHFSFNFFPGFSSGSQKNNIISSKASDLVTGTRPGDTCLVC
jgi:hypothetical protein